MSTRKKTVPVVTYALLPIFERKLSNKKAAREYRAELLKREACILKTKEENDKRLEEKRARRERVIVPFSYLQEKIKERDNALAEKRKQEKLEQDILREERDWAYRMMRFEEEIQLEKIVPIDVKLLPALFKESDIGKAHCIECEEAVLSSLRKFAEIVGFDVEFDGEGDLPALVLWKPYPYWREAFSDKKETITAQIIKL
ncbi:MAG: hypothetical protein WC878_01310 [Candidatus Paceibacterota bacterium]|jgi:hypothetical protein